MQGLLLASVSVALFPLLWLHASAQGVQPAWPAGKSRADLRLRCLEQMQLNVTKSFEPILSGFQGKIALLDAASIRDLGDCVLWLGAKRALYHYGETAALICSMTQDPKRHLQPCPKPVDLLRWMGSPAILLWHAGGNFGDVFWRSVHSERMRYIQEVDRLVGSDPSFANHTITVVQLASSLYYLRQHTAERDSQALLNLRNVKFMLQTRQLESYNIGVNVLRLPEFHTNPHAPVSVQNSLDLVYAIGHQTSLYPPRSDILLLVRQGGNSEAQLVPMPLALEIARNNSGPLVVGGVLRNVTIEGTDWLDANETFFTPVNQPADLSDVRLWSAMKVLSRGRVVVTNRLHASIIALLGDVPVFWYDGQGVMKNYSKLTGTNFQAWSVAPDVCTADILRSWHVPPATVFLRNKEEQATLANAVKLAYEHLQRMAADGEILQ